MRARIIIASFVLCLTLLANARAAEEPEWDENANPVPLGNVFVEFQYQRLTGTGSNQMAVWIETPSGNFVKSVFATQFTARGGWKTRDQALPAWVRQADVPAMTPEQLDAITSATPGTGEVVQVWDCTNAHGEFVDPGLYVVVLEGTLRGPAQVQYRATVEIGGDVVMVDAEPQYIGSSTTERAMIKDVKVRYEPPATY